MKTIKPGVHAGGSDVKYNIENRLNQVTNKKNVENQV